MTFKFTKLWMVIVAIILLIVVGVWFSYNYFQKVSCKVPGVKYEIIALSETSINSVAWVYLDKDDATKDNIEKITQCVIDKNFQEEQYIGIEFWDSKESALWKKDGDLTDINLAQQHFEHYIGMVDTFGWIFGAGLNYTELDMLKLNIEQ